MVNKFVANARRPKARRGRAIVGLGGNFAKGRGALGLSGGGSRATSRRTQVIEEDEYIGEVSGTVGFGTTVYPLNPGQSSTFPWAYKIAVLYEKYDFEQLEFYYKREVSEYASNGQTGKVILSFDYDASDSAPTSKQQVEDTVPHVDGMPSTPTIRLPIDCACIRDGPARYVRPGAQPANTDIKTYDAGNLYVSTYGCTGTTVVGELRVRYRCRFSEPVLEPAQSGGGTAGAALVVTSAAAGEAAGATTVYATMFASTQTPIVLSNGIGATLATSGLITLPSGRYLITTQAQSFVSSAVAVSASQATLAQSATVNTSLVGTYGGGTSSIVNTAYGAVSYSSTAPNFLWDTGLLGTTVALQVKCTYGSGSAYNIGYISIQLLSAANVGLALPQDESHVLSPQSTGVSSLLLARLSRLEKLFEKDSEFEEDTRPGSPVDALSMKAASSSSAASTSLSRSTLDVIGEIISRKSAK